MPFRFASPALGRVLWCALYLAVYFPGRVSPREDPPRAPGFYGDVLPILENRCQSCHRAGGIAPMPFETYAQTKPYAGAIRAAVLARTMPPWFADPTVGRFSNDPSLSPAQLATLASWAAAGAPAGNPADAPPAVHWAESWTIPKPDLVLPMTASVAIPATGEVDYTYEIVPTRFARDRWVRAVELLPGRRENVHHAVVYVRPPGSPWMRGAPVGKPFTAARLGTERDREDARWTDSDILLVYAPGSSPEDWPSSRAKLIPAGSDLVFQMHYTANGRAGSDRSRVGLRFSGAPAERVLTLQLTNDHFVIPPGAPNFRVEARGSIPNDSTLLGFFPHMHLRGKRFEYNLLHTGAGSAGAARLEVTPLLRVQYHFHWQMSYRLAEPLALPAGTILQAVGFFDNSAANPHNPDPAATVRWGEQTREEMMVGFFDVAVPVGTDKARFFERRPEPGPPGSP